MGDRDGSIVPFSRNTRTSGPEGRGACPPVPPRRIFLGIETDETEKVDIDVAAFTRDGRTFLPFRGVAEAFIANAVIDIGKIILAGEKVDIPGTYMEVFARLNEAGILS